MVIQKLHEPRKDILKQRHVIATQAISNLQKALELYEQSDIMFDGHHDVCLKVIHCYELAFHAVCNYLAEQLQSDYEFETPEQSARQLFEQAYISDLIDYDEHEACLAMVNAFALTADAFKEPVAYQACKDIIELFEVLCAIAQYNPLGAQ